MNEYLQVNTSVPEMVGIVTERIRTRTPFCMSRLGDGELFYYNGLMPVSVQQRLCESWGYAWPEGYYPLMDAIGDVLYETILESDVIGILNLAAAPKMLPGLPCPQDKWSIKCEIVDRWHKASSLTICDYLLPRYREFGDPVLFGSLVLKQVPVNIVTPYDEELRLNRIGALLDTKVSFTHVDMNMTMAEEEVSEYHLKLANIEEPVVLYGTSIALKDTGILLKSLGKIALDYGATLDAWAGIESRGRSAEERKYCFVERTE